MKCSVLLLGSLRNLPTIFQINLLRHRGFGQGLSNVPSICLYINELFAVQQLRIPSVNGVVIDIADFNA